MKVEIAVTRARMRAPFSTAYGEVAERSLIVLALEGNDGVTGFGEAAPLEPYDGVSVEHARAALEDCAGLLARSDGEPRDEVLGACRDVAVLPQALAAIDLALLDLAARRSGQPVWRLLGAGGPPRVAVNATIGAIDRAGAAREAAEARAAGFTCVKVKVGVGDDAGRLAAVRAVGGPELAIRIDANGTWSAEEAIAALAALAPVGLELCEEPASGIEEIARVAAASEVPIAIDETAAAPGALDRRWCDAVCLKIARGGGITGVLDQAARARETGYEVYLASTFDGPLGIAAAVHAAAVLDPQRACGLATLSLFAGRGDPLPVREGRVAAPDGPGLGDGLAEWYR
ncbi:MAG TPA: mandelate racemase/muconate lactonizing enzyme family protein [Solirubrobacteraceae bacterium]|nr:mandelate racemase/muconate lactonizing enzyme family protein [Solirubrobacteraceae bacterium]